MSTQDDDKAAARKARLESLRKATGTTEAEGKAWAARFRAGTTHTDEDLDEYWGPDGRKGHAVALKNKLFRAKGR